MERSHHFGVVFLAVLLGTVVSTVIGGTNSSSSSYSGKESSSNSNKQSITPSQLMPNTIAGSASSISNSIVQEKATSRQARDYSPPGQSYGAVGGGGGGADGGAGGQVASSYGAPQAISGGYGGSAQGGGYTPQYAIPPIVLVCAY